MPAEAPAAPPGDDEPEASTKGQRTRQRILELAIDRFGAKGFRATSVSEIARAAGLTQAAVYAYFASKDDLFVAAVDTDAERVLATARARATEAPARQLVPLLLVVIIAELERHPLLARVVSGQEPNALQRLIDLPALAELTRLIADAIAEAQRQGEVRADLDPELFASGAEAIMLSLIISMSQVGSSTVARRQLGVLSIFDAVLRPPEANDAKTEGS